MKNERQKYSLNVKNKMRGKIHLKSQNKNGLLSGLLIVLIIACTGDSGNNRTLLNFSHLEHLIQEVNIEGIETEYVAIYAESPDYRIKADPDEGITCVDDVSRAAILYLRHFRYTRDEKSLEHARKLLSFILTMQAPGGLFYNFRFPDMTINRDHKNSEARADWWSWRALWALAEGMEILSEQDPVYAEMLRKRMERVFPAIDSLLQEYPRFDAVGRLEFPAWLPQKMAADQAGVLILGLLPYYRQTGDGQIKEFIHRLTEGITFMQFGSESEAPYGCFLSWQNSWHAYGNIQAYALLIAGETLKDEVLITKALTEVENFYPYLKQQGYLSYFSLQLKNDSLTLSDIRKFPQIAYNIRPMVWATLKAYEITGMDTLARQAGELTGWLFGQNSAGQAVYNPETGRCFDGINNPENINRNSGAESTIEALLTILETEQNPVTAEIVKGFHDKKSR